MAKTSDSIHVALSPEQAFERAADFSRFDEWVVLHDGWRSPLPDPEDLQEGTTVSSVIKAKGTRVRFTWEVEKLDRPSEVVLKGTGKGGVKAKIALRIDADGDGSTVSFFIDLGGMPLMGPVGKAAALAVKGDIATSLKKFNELFG